MNRCIRLRSRSLVILLLFVTSLAFAYPFTRSRQVSSRNESAPPDTTYSPNSPAADSVYRQLIATGNLQFNQRDYEACLSTLKKAQALKPGVASVQDRILQVEGLLAQKKKNQAEYDRLIKLAGDYFAGKDYLNAKASFQLALDLRPDDAYAREQLRRTMEVLRSQKAQNILYDVAIANADKLFNAGEYDRARAEYENAGRILPEEGYPKEKINAIIKIMVDKQVREELYKEAITAADRFYGSGSYQRALLEYQKALQQKPDEPYPKERIAELQQVLAQLAALEKAYKEAIAMGDQLFSQQLYKDARSAFMEALGMKPKEPYPAGKIREIDGILAGIARSDTEYDRYLNLADSLYIAKNFISARQNYQFALQIKPGESYPKAMLVKTEAVVGEQMTKELSLQETYASVIAIADKLFADQALAEAKAEYESALNIKPGESYPQQRIREVEALQAAAMARQRELDQQYARVVANADRMFSDNLYPQALEQYGAALRIRPSESYPATKMTEIDSILTYMEQQRELDSRYRAVVAEANRLYTSKSWEPARKEYMKAQEIKPGETLPGDRIRVIDSLLLAIADMTARDARYSALITEADAKLAALEYQPARVAYMEALSVKPKEIYPTRKIKEIDVILEGLAEAQKRESDYTMAIASADSLFSTRSYKQSKAFYQTALSLKPGESHPTGRITEIDAVLAEQARLVSLNQQYEQIIASADQLFSGAQWVQAKEGYQQALDLFPDEAYPRNQLRIVSTRIDSIYRANKADYDKAVGEGDGFFNTFEYDRAIDAYTRATGFLPMEEYPREMIAKIRKTISENAIADVLNAPVIIKAGEEQKFPFDPVNIAARRNNFIYLKVKNLSNSNFNILIRYGRGEQTNGGLAIRTISTDGEVNERLISVKDQDPWYREDNNWISIYPQGGDIEVSFVQVSRAIK